MSAPGDTELPSPLRVIRSDEAGFEAVFARLEARREHESADVDRAVAAILKDVRERGDDAVLDAIERYDGYRLTPETLLASPREIEEAREQLDPSICDALAAAAERIRRFHAAKAPQSWRVEDEDEVLGQDLRPIARVGLMVPGYPPLPSTILMLAIPAQVAGVRELSVASSARRHHPAVLEAARLAGVQRVYRMGGAQGVGALAFGTASVAPVDKIVGPGSVYTQAAKRQVFGRVGIDADAGPSEVVIVADDSAKPAFVAADLLAQAEHTPDASVLLVTPERELAAATIEELGQQLARTPRREIAEESLRSRSLAVVTRDLEEAAVLANRFGGEHLQVMVREPEFWADRIDTAGAVFLGSYATVPLGDYTAGPSHVLPTGGTARFFSPVGVEDFLRRRSIISLGPRSVRRLGPDAVRLAELEGLFAHARAIELRLEEDEA